MKNKRGPRRHSREIALQILYEMDVSDISPEDAIQLYYELLVEADDSEVDAPQTVRPFAEQIVRGVHFHRSRIDHLIVAASEHWRLERMSIVDRNILRIALFEMLHCADIPPKVSINEAVDLGKAYGSEDSGAFINGILDHILPGLEQQDFTPSPPVE